MCSESVSRHSAFQALWFASGGKEETLRHNGPHYFLLAPCMESTSSSRPSPGSERRAGTWLDGRQAQYKSPGKACDRAPVLGRLSTLFPDAGSRRGIVCVRATAGEDNGCLPFELQVGDSGSASESCVRVALKVASAGTMGPSVLDVHDSDPPPPAAPLFLKRYYEIDLVVL